MHRHGDRSDPRRWSVRSRVNFVPGSPTTTAGSRLLSHARCRCSSDMWIDGTQHSSDYRYVTRCWHTHAGHMGALNHRRRPCRRRRVYRIGIVIITAAIGAGAHGDHVARLRHLIVYLAQRRSHLVGQRAGDDDHIRLARAVAWRGANPKRSRLVAGHSRLNYLDSAAGETEGHPHQGAGARPVDEIVRRRDQKALVRQSHH